MQSTPKKSYYWNVYKKHWKPITLLTLTMITLPLYIFFNLPPVEIVDKVQQSQEVPVTTQVTNEVTVTRNVTVNITEGASVFLTKQAPPPAIDSDMVIALDTSGSMAGLKLATAKAAINNLISVLNKSQSIQKTNDRIGLVTFGGTNDGNWSNDAIYRTGLGYVSNQTFLNGFNTTSQAITTGGITGSSTDIWAGLNLSLQLLVNNPRSDSSLQSVILLTDGVYNMGPFNTEVQASNYLNFLTLASNYSSSVYTPYSNNPVVYARNHGIKVHTIGLSGGTATYDANFLTAISMDPDYGTFGEFFTGNDELSLSESFLKARDSASGWIQLVSSDMNITSSGTSQLYSFNITENQRRVKWDVNWVNKSLPLSPTIIDPNGASIDLSSMLPENFNLISNQNPLSLLVDFPETGLWKFNISWDNVNSQERVLSRLSSYQPPVFIDNVAQLNTTNLNSTSGATSLTFELNVTNKNPLFNFHNIQPILLANFSAFNYTANWTPAIVPEIPFNSSTSFNLNLTFLEAVQIQGSFLMMVNSSEGYYDAYAQPLALDSRTTLTNSTVETVIETQTVVQTSYSTSIGYNYDRKVLSDLNLVAFGITFMVLFAITALYVRSKEEALRKLAQQLRPNFSRNKKSIEAGLQNIGIDTSSLSIDQLLESISHLDDLGSAIGVQTGTLLSTEDLIRVASGVTTDKVANRLSNKTGQSLNDILDLINSSTSIDEISQKLNISYDEFMFIITPDEVVDKFQGMMKKLVRPIGVPNSSRMFVNDDIDFNDFRNNLKNLTH